jgi:hypothetical protein
VQQCICAIELIGLRLLGREDEVDALRRVRDELLATTPEGREWIALFERVQTPLMGALLEDERLGRQAAELVTAAGALLADEQRVLDPELAEQARSLLAELTERAPSPELVADLRAVAQPLDDAAGRPAPEIIRMLMARRPQTGGAPPG